ncbi:MAG: c-type cytochrome [Rhodospirillaceae bacterium]|nr:c-type cytochrome [Rhodospirillaceae bacterium]
MTRVSRAVTTMTLGVLLAAGSARAAPDLDAGKTGFDRECRFCHSLKPGEAGTGPSLARIFGRRAGSQDNFAYSAPIRDSKIVWTEVTLDAYLADPAMLGTEVNMCIPGIGDEKLRAAIIAFLKHEAR